MSDPNVATGSSSTPNLLDTVGSPYQLSNAEAVKGTGYSFGQQSEAPKGSQPSFEKLQPKAMSTAPGPMGTNYKP